MIKLKSSNNVQTFYIAKGCSDVCISDNTLPMGSYTKAEADERFQPKGDYPTVEDVNIIKEDLENNIDELSNSLSSEIAELEVSKQETFQVNQPLYFERSDEDLTLNINLEDYATKEDVDEKQDILVSGENVKTINGESILGSGNVEIGSGVPFVIFNNDSTWDGDLEGVYSALQHNQPANVYYHRDVNDVLIAERYDASSDNVCRVYFHREEEGIHWIYRIDVFYDEGLFELDYTSLENPTSYYAGNNIEISSGGVISWKAPDVQFVNTIFVDNGALKYALADFSGEYIEKEFPLATTESAGLMSPEDKAKLDASSSGDTIPYLYIIPSGYSYGLGEGDYDAVKNAVINDTPCLIYWVNNTRSGTTATYGDFVVLFETAEWNNTTNQLEVRFHFEEGTTHIHNIFSINDDGTIYGGYQIHNYVNQSDYDTKVSEIDTAISDLQAQIGNIDTVLDNINGEVI